jgi:Family of unknown function (DUF5906)
MAILLEPKLLRGDNTMAKKKEPKANTPVFDALCKEIEERVGVTVESMSDFRAMIKDYRDEDDKKRSYYRERSTVMVRKGTIIILDADGSSAKACEDIVAAYTDKIQAEWDKVSLTLPKSEYATIEQAERQREDLGVSEENWYIMLDITRRRVIMCQLRVEKEDGSKEYWPYTFFKSDGWTGWRNKEPNTDDFRMPFWKPAKRRTGQLIMLHEGAKAARYADNLVNNTSAEWIERRANHPWAKFLARFEHWGIIGGALAPHRADYNEIIKGRKPERAVYVCDRDSAGEAALATFSRHYKGKLDAIRFDERFDSVKPGWDIADELPTEMFIDGYYKGEPMEAFLRPATWATGEKIIEPEGKGNPRGGPKPKAKIVYHLTDNFIQDWVHVVEPEVYIHRRLPDHIYSLDGFNNRVQPFSNIRDTAKLFQQYEESKIDSIDYNPTKAPGIVKKGRKLSWNIHHSGFIEPKRGDISPWAEYLEQTFPVPGDRREVEKWVYTLIACPQIKMHYGLLLCSEQQGVGKTTLGQNILAPILGEHNISYPSESDIVDSQFTHWKANVRLILANEIYAGHSSRAYNKLKDLMTDHIIRVNKKFMSEYNQVNWAHMIACSNSLRALKIPDEDRRWCVPRVTELKKPTAYWKDFNQWLSHGGLCFIMQEAFDWGRRKGNSYASIGDAAPSTAAKRKMVEEGYSKGQQLVKDWLEAHADIENKNGAVVVADQALVDLIFYEVHGGRFSEYQERPLTVRKVASRTPGWYVGRLRQTVKPPYGKGFLLANRGNLVDLGPREIEELGIPIYRDYNSLPK